MLWNSTIRFKINHKMFSIFIIDVVITQIEELSLYLLGTVGLFALMDRLVMGAFQRRSGPYSIGWFGLLQPIVDGIKLIKKESIIVQK